MLDITSPLDAPITVALSAGVRDTAPEMHSLSLRSLAGHLTRQCKGSKAQLPMLKLAAFEGGVSDHHLIALSGVEADYDGKAVSGVTPQEAAARLRSHGVAAIVYTSPSHTVQSPRWRVLAPLSAPASPLDHARLMDALNGALGGVLDAESWTRARRYFYGTPQGKPAPDVIEIEGGYLDRLDIAPAPRSRPEPDDDDPFDGLDLLDYAKAGAALDSIPHQARDDRDIWLRVGMALHHESGGADRAFRLWQAWSAVSPKFDQRDSRRTWNAFGRRTGEPVTLASLIALAREYEPPEASTPDRRGLTFLSPSDCENAPSRGYLIKGILAPGDVACIFGPPGAGKSLIAPHLGYALAQGRDSFGMRTKAGPVFYVAAEDPHGMRARITALCALHGDAPAFALVEGVSNLLDAKSPDLAALFQEVEARRPSLIVIDTVALAFPGLEENSAEAMSRVVTVARKLASRGAAVILVHHDTKADGGTPRGHSVLNGALDMALHIKRDDDGIVRGKLTKNRNGSCERDIAFTIGAHTIGEDEDGDPVTAAFVSELDGVRPRSKLTGPQSAAISILLEIERDKAADCPDFGASVRVTEAEYRAALIASRAVSGAENEDSRKRVVRRVIRELAALGRISVHGEFVRLANPHEYSVFDDLPPDGGLGRTKADSGRTRPNFTLSAQPNDGQGGQGRTQGGQKPESPESAIDSNVLADDARRGGQGRTQGGQGADSSVPHPEEGQDLAGSPPLGGAALSALRSGLKAGDQSAAFKSHSPSGSGSFPGGGPAGDTDPGASLPELKLKSKKPNP